MSHISVSDSEYKALANKTIVISGASSGIGEAAVKLASENGAKIVLGDVNEEAGEQVAKRCGGNVYFVKCNVASWQDWIKLFKKAHDLFGRIDVVIHNAGIYEKRDWLQDSYNESGEKDVTALIEPTFPVIDVNLKGALYATKLALHYFRKQKDGSGSLMFTGSIASYIDSPPLWTYGATKTGILGLMRALRHQAEVEKIWTVNMVAPWMTLTDMGKSVGEIWNGLPTNEPSSVAKALLLPACRVSLNGKTFFVGGDKIIEIEDKMHEIQDQWLTPEMSEAINISQERLLNWASSDKHANNKK